jgi:hypothetical protein
MRVQSQILLDEHEDLAKNLLDTECQDLNISYDNNQ